MRNLRCLAIVVLVCSVACRVLSAEEPPRHEGSPAAVSARIQWFSTLEPALKLAGRTGRPILFLSAVPHCGGVSGVW